MAKYLIIKKIIAALSGLFFVFLPFERLLTLEVYGLTAKISFAILLILILIFLFGPLPKKLFLEEKILLGFSALSFATVFWSIDFKRSAIIATIFLVTFLGFIALRRMISFISAETVKTILIYLGLILAPFAFWQYFGDLFGWPLTFLRPQYTKIVFGFPRPQVTFLEPLYFANFLFLPIFFSIERIIKKQSLKLNYSVLFLVSAVFLLALSRGAYIGLVVGLIILLVFCALSFKKNWRRLLFSLATIILGILAASALLYFSIPRPQFDLFVRHAGIADTGGESTVGRLYTSELAWRQAVKNPLGIGAGAFGALPEFTTLQQNGSYQTVGNLYPEILVEEGFAGLILFLIFLFLFAKYQWQRIKNKNFENLIYLAIFAAIFIQAFAFSSLYILPIWAFLALAWQTRMDSE